MVEIIELIHQMLTDGLTWSSAIAIVLAILKIKDGQHKKRVNTQQAKDIRDIKEALGIWSNGDSETATNGATNSNKSSLLLWAMPLFVLVARKYIHWRRSKMTNINKGILLPLLSAIALFVKEAFNVTIPEQWIDVSADLILYIITIIGIFISPKKPDGKSQFLQENGE